MINDLKNATQRWDRERGSGSRRGSPHAQDSSILQSYPDTHVVTNYEDSHTYRTSTNGYGPPATGSPQLNGPFQPPPRANLPPADMSSYTDPRPLYPSHSVAAGTSAYVDPSMYVPHARQNPAGYPPQVEFYGSSQPYGHDAPSQHYPGPQYPVAQYGQAPQRDPRDDPRYQPDYQDPQMRYSTYPPVSAPNGVTASSPSQASRSETHLFCISSTCTDTLSVHTLLQHTTISMAAVSATSLVCIVDKNFTNSGPATAFSQAPSIPDPPYRPSPSVDPGYHSRDRPSGQPGGDARRRRIG